MNSRCIRLQLVVVVVWLKPIVELWKIKLPEKLFVTDRYFEQSFRLFGHKEFTEFCQKWFSNHSSIGELRTGNRILKKKSVVHHYLHTRCNLEIPVNPEVATCLEKQIKNQTYKTWQLITLHLNPRQVDCHFPTQCFFAHSAMLIWTPILSLYSMFWLENWKEYGSILTEILLY